MNHPSLNPVSSDQRVVLRAAAFAAVVIACHLPLVWIQLHNLWFYRPHYEFFPLLLAGVSWLIWKRWPGWSPDTRAPIWSSVVLGFGFGMLAIAVLLWAHWLATVALIVSLCGLLGRHWPAGQWREWLPVWLLLWLMVPPPLGLDYRLITRLQTSTSAMASRVMDLLGILHLMEGNVLVLPGHRMLVDEACSGVNSVLVLLTLTAMYVVAVRRPLIWSAILLPCSIAWAWAANTVRVTTIAIAQAWFEWDLSTGWQHEVLGYVTMSLALIWLISTDYCLSFLLSPIRLRRADLTEFSAATTPLTTIFNRLVGARPRRESSSDFTPDDTPVIPSSTREQPERKSFARGTHAAVTQTRSSRHRPIVWSALFGVLGLLQVTGFTLGAIGGRTVRTVDSDTESTRFGAEDLSENLGGWQVIDQEYVEREQGANFGQFSSRWIMRHQNLECIASVDRPFWGWHDLTSCYAGTGWTFVHRVDVGDQPEDPREARFVQAQFSRPTGEVGWLVFGLSDAYGQAVVPPLSGLPKPRFVERLRRNPLLRHFLADEQFLGDSPLLYQIQVFASSDTDLTTEQRDQLRNAFFEFREAIVDRLRQREGP